MTNRPVFHNRHIIVTFILIFIVFLLSQCINDNSTHIPVTDNRGEKFAGSASCFKCHNNICDSFTHTAHYLSSRIANSNSIKGSFQKGRNLFIFGNTVIAMESSNNGFYQTLYNIHSENGAAYYQEINSKPFDIVIGSNTKGQTYLYWKKNELYQLPVSYFTVVNNWCNSPGYPFRADYSRSIGARCLECHSTYAKVISAPNVSPEQFNPSQIIYGIDCEKCHGPAARHVIYQEQHPENTVAKYIINPAKLSREQNLDLCSLCHSGSSLHNTSPSFNFTAGDTITNYFKRDSTPTDIHSVDVHGNQYGLLRSSLCFKKSEMMTCNTCHNTHKNERGNTILFSQRCVSCHNANEAAICPLTTRLGATVINKNCIDCHMPVYSSKSISVSLPGDTAIKAASVRSHYISIYPEETDRIIRLLKEQPDIVTN